ncbi:helix-hairpin-helix domain-containing protein [Syntrophomonas palmitatica]|uniref:helix-hairpin-helix domain-containing protein n=1 Tax=Syntrophomonas palmitatica TaxID=402877 RepID=UPI000B04FBB6|nr:OB-fold nucleic acid binding domain-containing protein [Syntrophomonas palmitatica]
MAQRDKFVNGAVGKGIDGAVAARLFDIMESFAGYGFNKSHSAAYAMISYQTAYLKTHYPLEYMCAFLSSVIDNQDRVVYYLKECQRLGINVLPPDINESYENFSVAAGGIRFGLGAIKNIGINAVKQVVEIRKTGPFSSLFDFCRRVDPGQLNKRMLENLIVAGCFDSLGITRKQALSIMDECLNLALKIKESESSQQMSLFGEVSELVEEPQVAVKGELDNQEKLRREKEVLGFYVSANPLDAYRDILSCITTHQLADLQNITEDEYVRVAGTVLNLNRRVSRKGDSYARFDLEDLSGRMEVMVFPSAFRQNMERLNADQAVIVEGFLDTRDETPKLSLRRLQNLPRRLRELHLRLAGDDYEDEDKKRGIMELIANNPGDIEVYLHLPPRRVIALNESFNVQASLALKKELAAICGQSNVWYN